MRKPVFISALLIFFLTAGLLQGKDLRIDLQDDYSLETSGNNTTSDKDRMEEKLMNLSINGQKVTVKWESNQSVKDIENHVVKEKIIVHSSLYGGFEQVGRLPRSFKRNDVQMTTTPGDIVLYSGNQIVIFFGSNTWSYTKLGHIENLSLRELENLLGNSTAEIVLESNE